MGLFFFEQITKTLRTIFGCLRTWCLLSKIKLLAYQSRPLDSKATMKTKKKIHFLHFPEKTDPRCDMWAKTLMPTFTHTAGTRKIIVIY